MIEHLNGRAHVAPGGVNIGVVHTDDERAILIDTGLNDTAVRKVLRGLREADREVAAIVTTHGHADHFGGNAFTVKRTGAPVYAPAYDEATMRYPIFQPLTLFAGADPPASMRTGFMLAEASPVDEIYGPGPLEIAGVELEVVGLPGHSLNQMGIMVDGVFYCADVVLPERVIERYKMPYLYALGDHLNSLDVAESQDYLFAVPGHGPVLEDAGPVIESNRELVLEVADRILGIATTPMMPEEILAELLLQLGAEPADPAAYYLLHPTVFAFLSYLEAEGRMTHTIERARSLWVAS